MGGGKSMYKGSGISGTLVSYTICHNSMYDYTIDRQQMYSGFHSGLTQNSTAFAHIDEVN